MLWPIAVLHSSRKQVEVLADTWLRQARITAGDISHPLMMVSITVVVRSKTVVDVTGAGLLRVQLCRWWWP